MSSHEAYKGFVSLTLVFAIANALDYDNTSGNPTTCC